MTLLPRADPLLTLAVVIVAGVISGRIARFLGVPRITGQIVAGLVLGAGLHVFERDSIAALQPVTHFALGLMAVTVGAHLNVKRMRNAGKRLSILMLSEALITPAIVITAMGWLPGMSWSAASLLGAIAVSTAPATIVALVKESRAKGVFVKTLVAAVALNNVACILLFELARSLVVIGYDPSGEMSLWEALLAPGEELVAAMLLGGGAALAMHVVNRFVVRPDLLSTAGILAILLTSGISKYLEVSPLLSCLFLGLVQTNLTPAREKLVDALFSNFEPAILAVFFTLAGMNLHVEHMKTVGLVAIVFFFARSAGKLLSVHVAMKLAGATERVRRYLGMALLPQAGLAIGLVLLIQDDPNLAGHESMLQLLLAVVLSVVTANEIIGPILTRIALSRAGELGMDRTRLLDFIQEENIVTQFDASGKEDAIAKLVDHMIRSHHLDVDRATLLATVMEREQQGSTCLGGGLAVPHTILPESHAMVGVMGITHSGLDVPTPDGRRVHCMTLLGTSEHERDRHLQVLATLARTVGMDSSFQDRLFNATTPAHAAEILHGENSETFNYFLE